MPWPFPPAAALLLQFLLFWFILLGPGPFDPSFRRLLLVIAVMLPAEPPPIHLRPGAAGLRLQYTANSHGDSGCKTQSNSRVDQNITQTESMEILVLTAGASSFLLSYMTL